jgi:hypothetical protein
MAWNGLGDIIYPATGFLIGLGLIYSGVKKHLFVQKINNLPTSKAEGAAIGLVELCGKARCHDPTVSPLSKADCAYWRIHAEYYRPGRRGGWMEMFFRDSSKPFYLEDETGKMLVDPTGADIDIPRDKFCEGYISGRGELGMGHTPMPAEALEFINGLDIGGKAIFMSRQYENVRISEYHIAEGDPLFVLGSAEPQAGAATGIRDIIVKKGRDKLLYISDTGERKVVQKFSREVYLYILGGLVLSAACLLIALTMSGMT